MEERKLVAQFKRGNVKSMNTIIEEYALISSNIVSNISDGKLTKSEIENTVADVFITLWNNYSRSNIDELKWHIVRISKEKARERLNSLKITQRINIFETNINDNTSVCCNISQSILQKPLQDMVNSFSKTDREIAIRYYFYCQSLKKIAVSLNLTYDFVKSKLIYINNMLRYSLKSRGYTDDY